MIRHTIFRKNVLLALIALILIYGSLVVFSVVLHKFVVYARIARQMTPFFCIISAIMLNDMMKISTLKKYAKTLLLLALIQGCYNFYDGLSITYYENFDARAKALMDADKQYSLLYVRFSVYPLKDLPPLPPHRVILEKRGPQNYYPSLYEGFLPDFRKKIKTSDMVMRLIQYDPPVYPPLPLYLP